MPPSPTTSADDSDAPPNLPSFLALGSALWGAGEEDQPMNPLPPQVYIGCGRYGEPEDEDEGEIVYEVRLLGIGGTDGERTDTTLTFPNSADMVLWGAARWDGWVQAFRTGDQTILPALLSYQRWDLLVIARFLRALCRQGPESLDIAEWPRFWAVFMEGFPPCQYLMRGEAHLHRVSQWLQTTYPTVMGHH